MLTGYRSTTTMRLGLAHGLQPRQRRKRGRGDGRGPRGARLRRRTLERRWKIRFVVCSLCFKLCFDSLDCTCGVFPLQHNSPHYQTKRLSSAAFTQNYVISTFPTVHRWRIISNPFNCRVVPCYAVPKSKPSALNRGYVEGLYFD